LKNARERGRASRQEKLEKTDVFLVSFPKCELPRSDITITVAYGQRGLWWERSVYFGC